MAEGERLSRLGGWAGLCPNLPTRILCCGCRPVYRTLLRFLDILRGVRPLTQSTRSRMGIRPLDVSHSRQGATGGW